MSKFDVLFGFDPMVAQWAFMATDAKPMLYNACIGVLNKDKALVGAFMFTAYNGSDAEIHYYGPGTLTRKVIREIFLFSVKTLDLNRLTIRTRKDSMSRGVKKLGAEYEGTLKRVYGPLDIRDHTAEQFVFFRERMEELAGLGKGPKKCAEEQAHHQMLRLRHLEVAEAARQQQHSSNGSRPPRHP